MEGQSMVCVRSTVVQRKLNGGSGYSSHTRHSRETVHIGREEEDLLMF